MSTATSTRRTLARGLVVLATAWTLAAATAGFTGAAWGSDASRPDPRDTARGMVYAGLAKATTGPCAGGYEIRGQGLTRSCTHGPDPAPAGVDVTAVSNDVIASSGTATDSAPIPCINDGVTGPRIQVVYAVASDRTDRYGTIAPQIVTWAGQMENAVEKSAQQTSGQRFLRFVTKADCTLDVAHVNLTATGDDTFGNTISELRAQGFDRTDRKYVIWADAVIYCGIGQVAGTDSPDAGNLANLGPNYGRVDTGCWNRTDHSSPLHELFHTLGAVQPSAPHATSLFHCTDESDALCYSDAAGVTMTQTCPLENEWLLDCGNDDYFHTAPAASSYLATHWNTANSYFMAPSLTAPDPLTGGSSGTATPTTTTDSFTGTISSKKPSVTYSLSVGAGGASSVLTFSASGKVKTAPQLSLKVLDANGATVASGTGPSVLTLASTLGTDTYRLVVSGTTSVTFTLKVTHVTG